MSEQKPITWSKELSVELHERKNSRGGKMAAPTRSVSTDFSAGSVDAAERQFYSCTTVLKLKVLIIGLLHV